jgi:hypothetical protein
MDSLLHVIVGAGIPNYFHNCIDSVLRHSRLPILAVYNSLSREDSDRFHNVKQQIETSQVVFLENSEKSGSKTGSLYLAYNQALDYAERNGFDFVNLIQSDMQVFFWDDGFVSTATEIFTAQPQKTGQFVSNIFTQIPQRGKRLDYFSIWSPDPIPGYLSCPGESDVGIFKVQDFRKRRGEFTATEKANSALVANAGGHVVLHPKPFLAPIPFPLTVRKGRMPGMSTQFDHRQPPLLEVFGEVPDFDLSSENFRPIFMEDIIRPRYGRGLTPYWPSSTEGTHWISIRLQWARGSGKSIFARTSQGSAPLTTRERLAEMFSDVFRVSLGMAKLLKASLRGRRRSRKSGFPGPGKTAARPPRQE